MKVIIYVLCALGVQFSFADDAADVPKTPAAGTSAKLSVPQLIEKLRSQTLLTPQMIDAAKEDSNIPYTTGGELEPYYCGNGRQLYRPNHGILFGARCAKDVREIAEVLLKKLNDPNPPPISLWLEKKITSDPDFLKKMSVIAIAHRMGRTGESAFSEKEKTESANALVHQFDKSKKSFSGPKRDWGIDIDKEAETYKKVVELDWKIEGDGNNDASYIARLQRAAHMIDGLRVIPADAVEKHTRSALKELTDDEYNKLTVRAKAILVGSGVNLPGYLNLNKEKFCDLSFNTKSLVEWGKKIE